ncbi:ETC complex I subunit [Rhodospirillaceae bacterium KN72]|uniref:ETC complex I subunit n=1 Tax=Pacificispira spongiicola TaxID=2729598 RepID=A0A7Y0HFQ2_9PROT|nr:ETC complex I subunit [Pacificispira spongiicola]NMM46086.1 ETC complex I subunit [Pacificispira spongiicola]
MEVRIFKPAKTAMQSGRGKTKDWIVEFEPTDASRPDPLMGWVGSADTRKQVRLSFETEEEAVAYAKKQGYSYTVEKPKSRRIKPKAYADNFAYDRRRPWTH